MTQTIHLRPSQPLAERVLLPGDPGRALRIAKALTDKPLMFNHHRGLWGYTGTAADGELLTVQATGMGGPSASIVIEELIMLGARTLVRVGTCGALDDSLEIGELIALRGALAADGASQAMGATGEQRADPELTAKLDVQRAPVLGASVDLFYDPVDERPDQLRAQGVAVLEMEAAALFRIAERRGVRAACALLVSDIVGGARIDQEVLEAAEPSLGAAAFAAIRTG